jgi:sigma-B regulation protein RsbU (phosphoserine phosphatase)
LPGTFDGVAVPVIYRNNVIGVLDVQSTSQEGFDDDEARILNTLGDGLAAALVNLRLLTDLQTSVARQEAENAALRSRLQSLRQADRASRNVWERLVVSRNQAANGTTKSAASSNAPLAYGFNFDGQQGSHIPASDLPPSLRAVLETGAHQVRQEGDVKVISVPINLRGQLLGAMSFSVAKDRVLSDKQIETAKIVAERLALALENRQLFEQTQAQAERERKASEAASLFITSTDVESVMNVAVRSFNEALGAIHTRIHLQPSAVMEMERGEEVGA